MAMDQKLIYGMGGMLAALLVGGIVLDRLTAPQGTMGSLHEVLPAARARAHAWTARSVLVGIEGRDLVDGRNRERGAWEFVFADPDRPGRLARVLLGGHLLAMRELPAGSAAPGTGPFGDEQFGDSRTLARRLVAYGMRPHALATFSLEASGSAAPVFRVRTAGRLAATWWIDAKSGDLLEYEPGGGK